MQVKNKKFGNKPNHNSKGKFALKRAVNNSEGKSLLQKISSYIPTAQKQNHSGKLVITKLNDYIQDKCLYGNNCAHLRAQSKCQYLHQKRDFQSLNIPLPQKCLQNQEPLKKSKQQRKEDKIRERNERKLRLKEKLQRHDKRQERRQERQPQVEQNVQHIPVNVKKIVEQKNLDKKQVMIQKMLKADNGSTVSLGQIYEQLNQITDAICQQEHNTFQQQFNLKQLKMPMFQVRKRLLVKFKKNKELQILQKKFIEKEGGFIVKIIKNIFKACTDLIDSVKGLQKCESLDLRQIQQVFTLEDIERVLKSRKQNQATIQYYFRFFKQQYGFPVSFDVSEGQQEEVTFNKGSLLPLKQYQLLPIISPNFQFERIFLSLDISYTELRALSEFSSLINPQKIAEKTPVQKTLTIDISSTTYSKFVQQMMTQYLAEYHQRMKGPAKQFEFGKIQQNLAKFRLFLAKYKAKVESQNKQNNFVLVVFNIKKLLTKIQDLGLSQNLGYGQIKKDRTLEEQNVYQRVFLLKEFISIMGQNSSKKLKVVYVNNGKKLKFTKYRAVLQQIDAGLKDEQDQGNEQQIQEQ